MINLVSIGYKNWYVSVVVDYEGKIWDASIKHPLVHVKLFLNCYTHFLFFPILFLQILELWYNPLKKTEAFDQFEKSIFDLENT